MSKGNLYVEMKTPDVDGPKQTFSNPDYFNDTPQQQQQQQQLDTAATRPKEYFNVDRR